MAPGTVGIHHVAVLTHDLHELKDFYAQAFGSRVLAHLPRDGPIARHALLDVGGGFLHLMEVPGATIVDSGMFERGRLDHLALSVPDERSLREARDSLVRLGASAGEITDFGVALSVHFRDPGGMDGEVCWTKGG